MARRHDPHLRKVLAHAGSIASSVVVCARARRLALRGSRLRTGAWNSAVLASIILSVIPYTTAQHMRPAPNHKNQTNAPEAPSSGSKSIPRISFEDDSDSSGITFQLKNSVSPQRYSIETMLGGIAVFDYNNDGFLDIFFTNGASIPSLQKSDPSYSNRLFRNNGNGTFTDVTASAGVEGIGYSMGVAAGDFDNDGNVDLYVAGVEHNQLLHNQGNGKFRDVTQASGVSGILPGRGKLWSVAAGWFDYDNDGLLDLLVINYLDYDVKTAKLCEVDKVRTYCAPGNFRGTPNILYHNNGDGTFSDVSGKSHIGDFLGKGMGVAFADYDNDGFPDVFISNDTMQNFLFHNNGDGTFKEVGLDMGVAYTDSGGVVAGMGADFRDLDNDGLPDILHTAMTGDTFPVYRNAGAVFDDVTESSGMTAFSRHLTAWGTGAFDFDNDGLKDIFVAGGAILDNEMEVLHRPTKMPNGVLLNTGEFKFEDARAQLGEAMNRPLLHRGVAFGDFNNDGKVDAVVSVLNDKPQLLMNRSANRNHWIILKLVGTRSNRDGLGTRVKIQTHQGAQFNHATTTGSYNSSSDKRVHFGLGEAESIDHVDLSWPSGQKQSLTNVKADQVLTITEPYGSNHK